jgi:hypothetical protein
MGDAILALTANMAARQGKRIEFKKEWFDIRSDETPEGVAPSEKAQGFGDFEISGLRG